MNEATESRTPLDARPVDADVRRAGRTSWEIAVAWYRDGEIYDNIQRSLSLAYDGPKIPTDVYSREFADWLTEQYRLAMAKGIRLARFEY